MKTLSCVLVVSAACLAAGCTKKDQSAPVTAAPKGSTAGASAIRPELFLDAAPEAPSNVKEVKATAKTGDRVVLRGRIGGSVEPFVSNRAVFTLMDYALPSCSDNPDDHCKTPWDYCCEKRSDIVAHACTVQVLDKGGQPVKATLRDVGGLRPAAEVVVIGVVTERDDAGNLVLDAKGIYVKE